MQDFGRLPSKGAESLVQRGSSMRARHHLIAALLAAAVLAPIGAGPAQAARDAGWAAPPTAISGSGRHVAGEWVWQDFVYDDGGQLNNEADIVEVRARRQGSDLQVRVTLNSLFPTSPFAVGAAVEDGAAELRAWPSGAGVSSRWTSFVTATPAATFVTSGGERTEGAAPLVDHGENTVDFTIPKGAQGGATSLVVAAGRWNEAAGSWTGRPADLAFNLQGTEPPFAANEEGRGRTFRNGKQQAAINAGDVSAFVQSVDLAALRAKRTDPERVEPGRANRVYRTRQALGEGYGSSFPRHRGLYMPYAVYVPTAYDPARPAPLAIVMHSLNNIHNEYDTERVYEDIAESRGAVAVTPLALGTDGWYWDRALIDTLDVWVDARRSYSIDDRQTTVSGYSMGGYGSWRLSTLLPDRIAAAAVWAGVPAYQIWAFPAPPVGSPFSRTGPGNTFDQLENTRHVPFMVSHGTNDVLVPVAGVTWQTDRLQRLQHSYRYNLHPGFGHFSFRTLDDYTREGGWLTDRTRVDDPDRVTFKVRPDSWVTPDAPAAERADVLRLLHELVAELGGDLRSAYWVSGVQVTPGSGAIGNVDLSSGGRAATSSVEEHLDPLRTEPSIHTMRGLDRTDTAAPTLNRLSGTLRGVTELAVDLDRAGLTLDGLELDVTSDRMTTLHLRQGATTRTVTIQPAGLLG